MPKGIFTTTRKVLLFDFYLSLIRVFYSSIEIPRMSDPGSCLSVLNPEKLTDKHGLGRKIDSFIRLHWAHILLFFLAEKQI